MHRLTIATTASTQFVGPTARTSARIIDAVLKADDGSFHGIGDVIVPHQFGRVHCALLITGQIDVSTDRSADGTWTHIVDYISDDIRELADALFSVERQLRDAADRRQSDEPAVTLAKTLRAIRAVAAQIAEEANDPQYAGIYRDLMKSVSRPNYQAQNEHLGKLASAMIDAAVRYETENVAASEVESRVEDLIWAGHVTDLSDFPQDRLVNLVKAFLARYAKLSGEERPNLSAVNAFLGSLLDVGDKDPEKENALFVEVSVDYATSVLAKYAGLSSAGLLALLEPDLARRLEAYAKAFARQMLVS